MRNLLGALLSLAMIVGAFSCILVGPSKTWEWMTGVVGKGIALMARFTVGVIVLAIFTIFDAAITASLSVYQTATARPYLVPEAWHAFALRLNDRMYRYVLSLERS